jgi:Double zinc ribbon
MLKLAASRKPFGTPVRCPACRYPNLAIDIWCERCGRPLDLKPTQTPPAGPLPIAPVDEARPIGSPTAYCPNCGAPNPVSDKYCPGCGSSMSTAPRSEPLRRVSRRARRQGGWRIPHLRVPTLTLPALTLPRLSLPRLSLPRVSMTGRRLPRVPGTVGIVAAVVAVLVLLLIVPLAYARLPAGHPVAARQTGQGRLPSTAGSTSSPQAAALSGVEAKTGLRFATTCPTNAACLSLVSQTVGTDAAAVVFSTARSGGRQCAGYVFRQGGGWHFLDAVCGLPNQLSPLVGHDATVHVPNSCANLRTAPGLRAAVVGCIGDGTVVQVEGGPTYGDGRVWWQLKTGWMAHDFLVSP